MRDFEILEAGLHVGRAREAGADHETGTQRWQQTTGKSEHGTVNRKERKNEKAWRA